ncbi:MAG: type II toxin-antitoxin system HicA family toxin [Phormidesmis sp. FL-bin-119]|nr:type II toxin-antitoxin system HicA family toxin [Pedobacter sp.]
MKCSELLRKLKDAGWQEARQKGSHIWMVHPDKPGKSFPFPNHGSKEISKGLEIRIKKEAGFK